MENEKLLKELNKITSELENTLLNYGKVRAVNSFKPNEDNHKLKELHGKIMHLEAKKKYIEAKL